MDRSTIRVDAQTHTTQIRSRRLTPMPLDFFVGAYPPTGKYDECTELDDQDYSECVVTAKRSGVRHDRASERTGGAIHRSCPCAGSPGLSASSFFNHRSMTATTCANSIGRNASPF